MKIVLSWLNEYIDLNDISVEKIAQELTMAGLEVEGITDYRQVYNNFITAEVVEKEKHPNADKLSLCKVSTGNEVLQIVCGAPNVAAGQKVALACEGARIPDSDFVIKSTKLRGQLSQGMICSEAELGISNDHSGILVLPEDTVPGKPLAEAIGYNDVVFEIGITPNRPDALSHTGVARDLSALLNRPMKKRELSVSRDPEKIGDKVTIEIEDLENCPRYSAVVVKDVTIGESPDWMKSRLKMAGMRPINNIVDITNYIMLELGQPLHAFDLDNLSGSRIVVKRSQNGSKFTTLDSVERELKDSVLMICDGEKEVAIAGIMGGENSEVHENTRNILIESAYFNPTSVRRSARYLGLSTEASYRFERGTNYEGTMTAALRAAELMAQFAGGKVLSGELDVVSDKLTTKTVDLRYARIEKILGYHVPDDFVRSILQNLEFRVVGEDSEKITVEIPGFRPDVEREIDLIEEIARINGYDNIPPVERVTSPLESSVDYMETLNSLRAKMIGFGFNEIMNNSLQPFETAKATGEPVVLMNPLNAEMSVLRTSLIQGGLDTVRHNINNGEKDLMLFETGHVINKVGESLTSFENISEQSAISIILTGRASQKTWCSEERFFDIHDLKGYLNSLLETYLNTNKLSYVYNTEEQGIYEYSADIFAGEEKIGTYGKVTDAFAAKYDIKQVVFCAELFVNCIQRNSDKLRKYVPLLKYPKIVRDMALIFDSNIKYGDISAFIRKNSSSLLKSVDLFDKYENDKVLGEGKVSLAFTLEFFDKERTLTEEEVEKEFSGLINKITKQFNAVLRGN